MKGLFGSFLWTQWALNFKFWQNALESMESFKGFLVFFFKGTVGLNGKFWQNILVTGEMEIQMPFGGYGYSGL